MKLFFLYLCVNIVWSFKPPLESKDFLPLQRSKRAFQPDKDVERICKPSETVASMPGFLCKGQLIFQDNFDYSTIKQGGTFTPEVMFPGAPDYPFNVYLIGDHMRIKKGSLSVKPVKLESLYGEGFVYKKLDHPDCTGKQGTEECSREAIGPRILPPIVTGKITTKDSFSFKYGVIEVRAKMPKGRWIVPEIQLEPLKHKYGKQNYSSGIIRVGYVKGNSEYSRKVYGGPILSASAPLRNKYLKEYTRSRPWNDDYHIYAVVWKPDVISMYVDDTLYGEVKPIISFADELDAMSLSAAPQWKKGEYLAPFDEMFYISIGLNIGGVNEFSDDESKPWSNKNAKAMLNFWNARHKWDNSWQDESELLVDYVKVYAL